MIDTIILILCLHVICHDIHNLKEEKDKINNLLNQVPGFLWEVLSIWALLITIQYMNDLVVGWVFKDVNYSHVLSTPWK